MLIASLGGCGMPDDEATAAKGHTTPGAATSDKTQPLPDDPAMADSQPLPRDAEEDAPEEIYAGPQAPTGLAIDHDAGLVFVPDIGWMDVPSFAALYMNEPEKLPGEFDHQAVHELLKNQNN